MSKGEENLTAAELREFVFYSPDRGLFTWLPRPDTTSANRLFNTKFALRSAGTVSVQGYVNIQIAGKGTYRAHRLAWLYMNGEWPEGHLDHRNMDRRDNRIENLRLATRSENGANRKVYSNSKSGIKGVSPRLGRWCAQISVRGKVKMLGLFDTKELAASAYAQAAAEHFGEFARVA